MDLNAATSSSFRKSSQNKALDETYETLEAHTSVTQDLTFITSPLNTPKSINRNRNKSYVSNFLDCTNQEISTTNAHLDSNLLDNTISTFSDGSILQPLQASSAGVVQCGNFWMFNEEDHKENEEPARQMHRSGNVPVIKPDKGPRRSVLELFDPYASRNTSLDNSEIFATRSKLDEFSSSNDEASMQIKECKALVTISETQPNSDRSFSFADDSENSMKNSTFSKSPAVIPAHEPLISSDTSIKEPMDKQESSEGDQENLLEEKSFKNYEKAVYGPLSSSGLELSQPCEDSFSIALDNVQMKFEKCTLLDKSIDNNVQDSNVKVEHSNDVLDQESSSDGSATLKDLSQEKAYIEQFLRHEEQLEMSVEYQEYSANIINTEDGKFSSLSDGKHIDEIKELKSYDEERFSPINVEFPKSVPNLIYPDKFSVNEHQNDNPLEKVSENESFDETPLENRGLEKHPSPSICLNNDLTKTYLVNSFDEVRTQVLDSREESNDVDQPINNHSSTNLMLIESIQNQKSPRMISPDEQQDLPLVENLVKNPDMMEHLTPATNLDEGLMKISVINTLSEDSFKKLEDPNNEDNEIASCTPTKADLEKSILNDKSDERSLPNELKEFTEVNSFDEKMNETSDKNSFEQFIADVDCKPLLPNDDNQVEMIQELIKEHLSIGCLDNRTYTENNPQNEANGFPSYDQFEESCEEFNDNDNEVSRADLSLTFYDAMEKTFDQPISISIAEVRENEKQDDGLSTTLKDLKVQYDEGKDVDQIEEEFQNETPEVKNNLSRKDVFEKQLSYGDMPKESSDMNNTRVVASDQQIKFPTLKNQNETLTYPSGSLGNFEEKITVAESITEVKATVKPRDERLSTTLKDFESQYDERKCVIDKHEEEFQNEKPEVKNNLTGNNVFHAEVLQNNTDKNPVEEVKSKEVFENLDGISSELSLEELRAQLAELKGLKEKALNEIENLKEKLASKEKNLKEIEGAVKHIPDVVIDTHENKKLLLQKQKNEELALENGKLSTEIGEIGKKINCANKSLGELKIKSVELNAQSISSLTKLSICEEAFSKLHSRYEKSKEIMKAYANHAAKLSEAVLVSEDICRRYDARNEELGAHLYSIHDRLLKEQAELKFTQSRQINDLNVILKRTSIREEHFDKAYAQKCDECRQLSELLDELKN